MEEDDSILMQGHRIGVLEELVSVLRQPAVHADDLHIVVLTDKGTIEVIGDLILTAFIVD